MEEMGFHSDLINVADKSALVCLSLSHVHHILIWSSQQPYDVGIYHGILLLLSASFWLERLHNPPSPIIYLLNFGDIYYVLGIRDMTEQNRKDLSDRPINLLIIVPDRHTLSLSLSLSLNWLGQGLGAWPK